LKTANSRRTVPLPQSVADALAAHLAEFGPGREGFILTAPEGGPVRGTRFRDVWRRTLQSAGMVRVRPHDLRHFYASLLIDAGESVKVVQDRLGHASATVTLDTYGPTRRSAPGPRSTGCFLVLLCQIGVTAR
jgi:integrase